MLQSKNKYGIIYTHNLLQVFSNSLRVEKGHTCAKFGKNLHGVIKSLLAEQIEGIKILDVMYLLLLVAI